LVAAAQCWGNVLVESFSAVLKWELANDRPWWIRRLHRSLGYRGPVECETALAA
jgi:hypothetical protein